MSTYRLGLDLGSNSVGWILVGLGSDKKPCNIMDIGVRVFPEGINRDTKGAEIGKNEQRRLARGSRRQRARKVMRREALLHILRKNDLLPDNEIDLDTRFKECPYQLRKKGLDTKLTQHQFGRVLFHLNQRRGFKSNRKTGKANENSVVLKACNELQQQIEAANCRTLGEYFAGLDPEQDRYRNHYTFRAMYEKEFDLLWQSQKKFHPDILTDDLHEKIRNGIMFFQRPLKPSDELIGDCSLEENEKRCPKGHFHARRYTMLQDINNLEIISRDGSSRKLSESERSKILELLEQHKDRTYDQLRKALVPFGIIEGDSFNLEEHQSDNKKLKGDAFATAMRNKNIFGKKRWGTLSQAEQIAINDAVLDLDDDELIEKMVQDYSFNEKQIEAILKVPLPQKYMSYSLKAIRKLLPFMEQGLLLHEAKEKAGYEQDTPTDNLCDKLPLPDDLRNPIVNQTLFQVRKIINAIIREYGKPDKILIEMARDLKNSKRQREEISKKQRDNQKANDRARDMLISDIGILNPSRDDIIKYKLWEECNKHCPFTGKFISQNQLFGSTPEFQIEHILPYSKTLDDSYMNKTLCHADVNREKGDRTPFEAFGHDSDRYEEMLQRVESLPYPKRKRFTQKEVFLDKCIERKLNDTRYISKEVIRYLGQLGVHVQGTRGEATADLRWEWGVDGILNPLANSKNRDDHRHHAVDAAIIAVTEPKHLKELARFKYSHERDTFDQPWQGFRKELEEKVSQINVSHRVSRKVSGLLHKDTSYGSTQKENVYVCRKALVDLEPAMVHKIRDDKVRSIVISRLEKFGFDSRKGIKTKKAEWLKITKQSWATPLYTYSKKGLKIPIKKVRIFNKLNFMMGVKDDKGKEYRYLAPSSNHHIEIFSSPDGNGKSKRYFRVVSLFEAAKRIRNSQPVIDRVHENGHRFLMSLSINEMFMLKMENETYALHRIQKMDKKGSVILRPHTYSGKVSDTDKPPLIQRKSHSTIEGYKVTVDPLGRIHPAND